VTDRSWRSGEWRHGRPRVFIGILLMIAGVLLTADRFGLFATTQVLRWWPVMIIAMGASLWLSRADRRGRFWGMFWVIFGIALLLKSLGLIAVGLGEILGPLLLIFIGVRLVSHQGNFRMPFWSQNSTDTAHLFSVMSETKRINNDNPFKAAQISAFMGGCHLDLRLAVIPPGGEAVIDVFSMMGGTEIWVPANWTVVSQLAPIMGGVDDKRLPALPPQAGATEAPRRLLLRGYVIMGGLVIKN
jgi:predicted membrane protein